MFTNHATFSRDALAAALGDVELRNCPADLRLRGVCSDTRTLRPGALFTALRGEHFDAHDFLDQALAAGAAALLVQRDARDKWDRLPDNTPLILVNDTLTALGDLAAAHRRRFNIPVLAVAGSAGKTTTKDLCAAVLATQFNTLKTSANYNNRVGVPLTLLQLDESHEAAVIEIGTNEPGEIAELARICGPTHGLITMIAKEHLEKLIDLDGVEREELALFDYLESHGGVPLVNLDDERLARQRRRPRALTFGQTIDADVAVGLKLDMQVRPHLQFNDGHGAHAHMRIIGRAAGLNAIAAAAAGRALGVPLQQICDALGAYEASQYGDYARMRLEEIGGVTVLNDSYNAHPASMRAALATLDAMPHPGRVYAALGDMRELGADEQIEHKMLIAEIRAQFPFVKVLLVGPAFKRALSAQAAADIRSFDTSDEAAAELKTLLHAGDLLLVKGSRGIRMEVIISHLRAAQADSGSH